MTDSFAGGKSTKSNDAWDCTSTPSYFFVGWYSTMHSHNFNFIFTYLCKTFSYVWNSLVRPQNVFIRWQTYWTSFRLGFLINLYTIHSLVHNSSLTGILYLTHPLRYNPYRTHRTWCSPDADCDWQKFYGQKEKTLLVTSLEKVLYGHTHFKAELAEISISQNSVKIFKTVIWKTNRPYFRAD